MLEPVSAMLAMAGAATQQLVSKKLDSVLNRLTERTTKIATNSLNQIKNSLRIGFSDFLENTHRKCSTFKSILDPTKPIELMNNYVHLDLSHNGKKISDKSLILNLAKNKLVILTGLAGSGKSMLMKYITMRNLTDENTPVPLFFELRNLNKQLEPQLLTMIRTFSSSKDSKITDDQFELALRSGIFILMLDGFDEINHVLRDSVQTQIQEIVKNYPSLRIVISTRPDTRFDSWPLFYIYKINRLQINQVNRLIRILPYDKGVKQRFSAKVNESLYKSHTSFLSSPLLVTIMLLTFEQFAEIPEKMHIFYGQAFDALFQKHDAQKEQYERLKKTALSRDDFRSLFAAFCFISYCESSYSFNDDLLYTYSKMAIEYIKQSNSSTFQTIRPDDFISDMKEVVCMLEQDGLYTSFVHRSFQEYFTAFFISTSQVENVRQIIDRVSRRGTDNVIPMAFDINRNVIEKEWVLPVLADLLREFNTSNPLNTQIVLLLKLIQSIILRYEISEKAFQTTAVGMASQMPYHWQMGILANQYNKISHRLPYWGYLTRNNIIKHREKLFKEENSHMKNYDLLKLAFMGDSSTGIEKTQDFDLEIELDNDDGWWINTVIPSSLFIKMSQELQSINDDVQKRIANRQEMIGLLLSKRTDISSL